MKLPVKTFTSCLLLGSACVFSGNASASDNGSIDPIKHGEKELKKHCYKCHADEVYTREDRFVKSLDALNKQVVRCRDNTNTPWFDEDTDAVVQFLNKKYYRF